MSKEDTEVQQPHELGIFKPSSAIIIPKSFETYKPELTRQLRDQFPENRLDTGKFDNDMMLPLAGEVPHALLFLIMNGDNWEEAVIDAFLAHSLTQHNDENDQIGSNVQRLGIFTPFFDLRQDRPSRKTVPGRSPNEQALVKSQGSWSKAMAALLRHVAGVDYVVQLDGHSHLAAEQFQEQNIKVFNLTTAYSMLDHAIDLGLINGQYENVICGLDFGNLPLAQAIHQKYGYPLAIISKHREPEDIVGKSKTTHKLVHGDLRGKRVILVDDLVSSGGTIFETTNLVLSEEAVEIIVCAAHAVLSPKDYYHKIQQLLAIDQVKIVLTTNTLPLKRPRRGEDRSLPYLNMRNSDGMIETRQMKMLDVNSLIGEMVHATLRSKNNDQLLENLHQWLVPLVDPLDVYAEITGKRLEKPKIVAIYRAGANYEYL